MCCVSRVSSGSLSRAVSASRRMSSRRGRMRHMMCCMRHMFQHLSNSYHANRNRPGLYENANHHVALATQDVEQTNLFGFAILTTLSLSVVVLQLSLSHSLRHQSSNSETRVPDVAAFLHHLHALKSMRTGQLHDTQLVQSLNVFPDAEPKVTSTSITRGIISKQCSSSV